MIGLGPSNPATQRTRRRFATLAGGTGALPTGTSNRCSRATSAIAPCQPTQHGKSNQSAVDRILLPLTGERLVRRPPFNRFDDASRLGRFGGADVETAPRSDGAVALRQDRLLKNPGKKFGQNLAKLRM